MVDRQPLSRPFPELELSEQGRKAGTMARHWLVTRFPVLLSRRRFFAWFAQASAMMAVWPGQVSATATLSQHRPTAQGADLNRTGQFGYGQGGYGQGAYPARIDHSLFLPLIQQKVD